MKKLSTILITLALLTGIVFLTIPGSSVYAQDDAPPISRAGKQQRKKGLDDVYEEVIDRYEDMGYTLQDTDDVIRKLENWIERIEEKGEDPSGVQTILETFEANLAGVQTAYDAVGDLVETHPGFDSEGNVIDESLALNTLRSIAEGLLDVHQLGEDAKLALKWDIMAYRYQNAPEE
jgi:hypothetical protein